MLLEVGAGRFRFRFRFRLRFGFRCRLRLPQGCALRNDVLGSRFGFGTKWGVKADGVIVEYVMGIRCCVRGGNAINLSQ